MVPPFFLMVILNVSKDTFRSLACDLMDFLGVTFLCIGHLQAFCPDIFRLPQFVHDLGVNTGLLTNFLFCDSLVEQRRKF
uniref:Uncharacterized protein n=1 Tax=Lepeophtheirus salmonis TaxID=72036 RepID=A0A0K2TRK2_LEPSM